MDDEEVCLAIILAAYVFEDSDDDEEMKLNRNRRRVWRKEWVGRRDVEGFCEKLYIELRDEEPNLYHNFLRMTIDQFDYLLSLVTARIAKKDTVMRKSIPALNRLIITLRFLATGDSFRSLQYLFRVPANTISVIIPEVLDAIYQVLPGEYLMVCVSIHSFFEFFFQFF